MGELRHMNHLDFGHFQLRIPPDRILFRKTDPWQDHLRPTTGQVEVMNERHT